jgi:WD40 repeat protein
MTDDSKIEGSIHIGEGGQSTAGGDVTGRDKIAASGHVIQAGAGATVIVGAVPAPPLADEPPAEGECPFKGLRYFDQADADLFFGRELPVAKLVGLLREGRSLLVVVGASGSGKSSLVRAGLIPALERNQPLADGALPPDGSADWPVHVITPTARPLKELAAALTRDSESVTATATLMDDLARDPRCLDLAASRALQRGGRGNRLLLVVDQFEELFTACKDGAERKQFVDNLLTTAAPETGGPTVVVLTLRADFYAHCLQFENLRAALEKEQTLLGPMSPKELRRAIEEPAKRGGWEFEEGLVERLLKDAGDEPGALPLLSHALLETWEQRRGRRLTFKGYEEAGGVSGAIAQTAESVYASLPPDQQPIARNIFLRLTELGEGTQDTRRRAALDELITNPQLQPSIELVLKTLADRRLITTGQNIVEVAHEALIREWPTLRRWLDEDRAGLRLHRQLTQDAQVWARLNRDGGALYRGARLAQIVEWAIGRDDQLSALEREFVAASREQAEREGTEREARERREREHLQRIAEEAEARRQAEAGRAQDAEKAATRLRARNRVITAVGALALIAAIVAGALGVIANQRADEARRNESIAFSRQLAAQSTSLRDSQLDLSLLLGAEAVMASDTFEARDALLRGFQHNPRLMTFLRGHTSALLSAAFSPDGKTLASGSYDNTIILWDVSDPAAPRPLGQPLTGHNDRVYSVAFSPDGKTLASGSWDNTILLWDVSDPAAPRQLGQPLTGHTGFVSSVAFSPDGKTLASGGCGGQDRFSCFQGEIILWDVSDPAAPRLLRQPLTGHTNAVVWSVAFSPDGKTVASGNADGTIILWDVSDPAAPRLLRQPLTGHTNAVVWSVAFSPDGKTVASGSEDDTIILWDVSDPAAPRPLGQPLTGHTDSVSEVAFSPDGQTLASGSRDTRIILWDVSDPAAPRPLGQPLTGHNDRVVSVAFSPDGKTLASGSGDDTIILWDVSDPAAPRPLGQPLAGHSDQVYSVAFSPDGKMLATGSADNTIILWDVSDPAASRPLGRRLNHFSSGVYSVAFSPDGKTLASGGWDETLTLWDVSDPAAPRLLLGQRYIGFSSSVISVAFSPDGKTLASGSCGKRRDDTDYCIQGEIILRDVPSPLGQPLTGHSGLVYSVAFSPDGQTLASGSRDTRIILWDVSDPAAPRLLGQPLTGHNDRVVSVAFSPDGKTLASGSWDNTILLWDVSDPAAPRQLGQPLTGHTGFVSSVAFSPDGKTLASGSGDDTIILWDVSDPAAPRQLGQPLTGHSSSVISVAFSPDGKTLASGSCGKRDRDNLGPCIQGEIILWDVDVESWVARACRIANRNLTEAEWRQYFGEEGYRETCEGVGK